MFKIVFKAAAISAMDHESYSKRKWTLKAMKRTIASRKAGNQLVDTEKRLVAKAT